MARGKSINLFLMDNDPNGRLKCTIANWTGVVYKIPRTELDKCKERNDLKQSGVYFLFGTSDDTGKSVAYIGQAGIRKNGEGILYRLMEHKRNPAKDYWTEAVVFTTSNNSFGPTEISYLENRFCNMAIAANRYDVKNGNDPNPGTITEEKECEMEDFIEYAKIIMGILGHKLLEPIVNKAKVPQAIPSPELTCTTENDDSLNQPESVALYLDRKVKDVGQIHASGMQTPEGFVVLKGSNISPIDDHTISDNIKKRRKSARLDEQDILQEDVLFSSPSTAAAFVIGKSANGLIYWKNSQGISLKELENS